MTPPKRPNELYEEDNGKMANWRPIPDPTVLTTQQLLRELAALREILTARMDGYDRAIALLQAFADRQPTIAEVVVRVDEKFAAVQLQFHERDIRFDRAAGDTRLAVDAAFAAAKEAVNKSEVNFTKLVDQIGTQISNIGKTADDKITDIRDRLTAIEGRGQAYSQGFGWIVSAVGVVAAVVGAVIAVFFKTGGN